MYTHETGIRVRYSETDQMGFVYYGQYAAYFEVGRVEAMRAAGIEYAKMESEHGILMPVVNMHMRFIRPAHYDDMLRVTTTVRKMPFDDIVFETEIFRPNGKLSTAGRIQLCFLEAGSRKRIPVPEFIRHKLHTYFDVE